MNPFWWLLWGVAALAFLFVASAVVAAVVDAFREPTPCERCGYSGGPEDYRRNLN